MNTPHSLPLLRHAFSALVCLTSLGFASQLHAQTTTITTASGDGADTHANRQGGGDDNFGTSTNLQIRAAVGSNERLAYLRFDLGSAVPANITAPSLSLVTASDITATFTLYGLVDATTADALSTSGGWSETGLIFNTAPARSGSGGVTMASSSETQAGTPQSYAVTIGTFDLALLSGNSFTVGTGLSNATQSSGLTANLLSFLQADTNRDVSFVLTTGSTVGGTYSFYSKEFSSAINAPALSFSAVPEPSTYALLAGGMMMSVALLRRRRSQS